MPKPDVTEERKAQIIAAATAVFAKKGFYEARMDDIVKESGLSKGALYWYFDSKDAIITAILDSFFSQEIEGMGNLLAADIPVPDKLIALVRQVTADMQEMAVYQSIALEFYALAGRREEIRLTLLTYFKEFQSALAHLIQQGIDTGTFQPIDPKIVAGIFIAQMEGIALLWAFNPDDFDIEANALTAVELIVAGLSTSTP